MQLIEAEFYLDVCIVFQLDYISMMFYVYLLVMSFV